MMKLRYRAEFNLPKVTHLSPEDVSLLFHIVYSVSVYGAEYFNPFTRKKWLYDLMNYFDNTLESWY